MLKSPTGVVLQALSKPSGNPFIMPKRVAETDPAEPIKPDQAIGSGPFIFKRDEWKPGERVVYMKNPKYLPRAEPPSGLAGGKVAMVDRACFSVAPFSGHYEEVIPCGTAVEAGDIVGWLHDFDRIDLAPHAIRAGVDGIVIAQAWAVRVVQGQHVVVTGRVLPWRS